MRGAGTVTSPTSTAVRGSAFSASTPNQENYVFFRSYANSIADQLRECHREGAAMSHLAITGGEPLLHLPQVLEFLEAAAQLYPDAYTRLYTSGFGWNDEVQRALADAGLADATEENADYGLIQFPPSALKAVRDDVSSVALGLSIAIVEHNEEGMALRELKVEPII